MPAVVQYGSPGGDARSEAGFAVEHLCSLLH